MRLKALNCIICDKEIEYLFKDMEEYTNLSNAADIKIICAYGSSFDTHDFDAIICDDCLEKAVNSKKVRDCGSYVGRRNPFN
jgi:hypothetical protein